MKDLETLDDPDLIARIAEGDEGAFSCLFGRLMPDVFKLSYALLLDRASAEDAVQEAFTRLWKHAENWRPEASVKTWLLTIARNVCLDIIRKRRNDTKKHYELYKDHLASPDNPLENGERPLIRKETERLVRTALFLLPERQREAVTLVYYSGIQNIEAARIMGLNVRAFDSLLARARRSLRDQLGKEENTVKRVDK